MCLVPQDGTAASCGAAGVAGKDVNGFVPPADAKNVGASVNASVRAPNADENEIEDWSASLTLNGGCGPLESSGAGRGGCGPLADCGKSALPTNHTSSSDDGFGDCDDLGSNVPQDTTGVNASAAKIKTFEAGGKQGHTGVHCKMKVAGRDNIKTKANTGVQPVACTNKKNGAKGKQEEGICIPKLIYQRWR